MTSETAQEVLAVMREASPQLSGFAGRIERALAGSEPVGWTDAYDLEEAKKEGGMGFFVGETTATDIIPLYTHPAPTGVYAAGKVERLVMVADRLLQKAIEQSKTTSSVFTSDLIAVKAALAALAEGE